MKEIWKSIDRYEDLYQVSNLGRIKNIITENVLTPYKNDGYYKVCLCRNGKQNAFFVHRLVAIAFIPNPNNYPYINHKDETRDNNDLENLEWCTPKHNLNYGTFPERVGKFFAKPIIQKTLNGEFIKKYPSARQAERETGISNSSINKCTNQYQRQAGGFIWEFDRRAE